MTGRIEDLQRVCSDSVRIRPRRASRIVDFLREAADRAAPRRERILVKRPRRGRCDPSLTFAHLTEYCYVTGLDVSERGEPLLEDPPARANEVLTIAFYVGRDYVGSQNAPKQVRPPGQSREELRRWPGCMEKETYAVLLLRTANDLSGSSRRW